MVRGWIHRLHGDRLSFLRSYAPAERGEGEARCRNDTMSFPLRCPFTEPQPFPAAHLTIMLIFPVVPHVATADLHLVFVEVWSLELSIPDPKTDFDLV